VGFTPGFMDLGIGPSDQALQIVAQRSIRNIRGHPGQIRRSSLVEAMSRFLAWGIDTLILMVAYSVLASLANIISILLRDWGAALLGLAYFLMSVGYRILAEWFFRGQTVGKAVLGLRVMDSQGLRLHFSQVVIRNLLRVADSLPSFYLLGGLFCALGPKAQRLGDIVGNTLVIRNPRQAAPDLSVLETDKYNSFRGQSHLQSRLRARTTPDQASLALRALLGREEMDPQARLVLFAELREFFQGIVAFPPEATDGLSDEQYIRNVVETLYVRPETTREKTPALS